MKLPLHFFLYMKNHLINLRSGSAAVIHDKTCVFFRNTGVSDTEAAKSGVIPSA